MYANVSIMKPAPGFEQNAIESMQRFGAAARAQPGVLLCTTLRDTETGELVGLALWESEAAAQAAGPALMAAVDGDDFDTWFAEMNNHRLEEI